MFSKYVNVFKAFDDKNRLAILDFLNSGEQCACDILTQLNISQSTLSHHMKILVESGVISSRKEGKWTYYKISRTGMNYAKSLIDTFLSTQDKE